MNEPVTYRGYTLIGQAPLVDIYRGEEAGVVDSRGSISDAKVAIDQLFFLAETDPRVGAYVDANVDNGLLRWAPDPEVAGVSGLLDLDGKCLAIIYADGDIELSDELEREVP